MKCITTKNSKEKNMKRILHLFSLGLILASISSCSPNNDQQEQLSAENESLKIENQNLKQEIVALRETLKPYLEQQEKEKKDSKGLIYNDQISITKIETGYNPYNSQRLWLPTVSIMFKNISNRDITKSLKITVIFIDNLKGEQIDTDYQYLISSSKIFISGTTQQLSFRSSAGWYWTKGLDVTARIYVDDELVQTIKVINREFTGTIQ